MTATVLPGLVVLVYPAVEGSFPACEPIHIPAPARGGIFEAPRDHTILVAVRTPDIPLWLFSCGCPVDGGPNLHGRECHGWRDLSIEAA
jgi:hypothetical protein